MTNPTAECTSPNWIDAIKKPTPLSTSPIPAADMTRRKNVLTRWQAFQLRDYLAAREEELTHTTLTLVEIGEQAFNALGFTVTASNIKSVAADANLSIETSLQRQRRMGQADTGEYAKSVAELAAAVAEMRSRITNHDNEINALKAHVRTLRAGKHFALKDMESLITKIHQAQETQDMEKAASNLCLKEIKALQAWKGRATTCQGGEDKGTEAAEDYPPSRCMGQVEASEEAKRVAALVTEDIDRKEIKALQDGINCCPTITGIKDLVTKFYHARCIKTKAAVRLATGGDQPSGERGPIGNPPTVKDTIEQGE